MRYRGAERRELSLDSLSEQVQCTVSAFRDFRRLEFQPLRADVQKLHTCVDEMLDIVKFLKTGFKVSSWVVTTAAAGALFSKTMGWW